MAFHNKVNNYWLSGYPNVQTEEIAVRAISSESSE